MSEADKPEKSIEIIIMRHAQSVYNYTQLEFAKSNSEHHKYEHYQNRWINNSEIVDAKLSEHGVQQCKLANQEILANPGNIKYIFSSPLRRAVSTALLTFKDYPQPLEWRLLPWFREIILSQCDLGVHSIDLIKEHPFIDCSPLNDNKLWFLDYFIPDPENMHHQKMKEAYEAKPEVQTLIDYLESVFPNFEGPKQMYTRVDKTKEALREFIKQKEQEGTPVKDGEIAIVAHSRIMRYLHNVFDMDGEIIPENEVYFTNAQMIRYTLSL